MRSPRVIIFDDEPAVLSLLRTHFAKQEFDVLALDRPAVCPVVESNLMTCPNSHPCADMLMTDVRMRALSGIEVLRRQAQRGCKIPPRNKAIITSWYLSEDEARSTGELGHMVFYKPVELDELDGWIMDCRTRMHLSEPVNDRRASVRYPVNCNIRFRTGRGDAVHEASLLDISQGGFRFVTYLPLMRNESLTLLSDIPAPSRAAVVRWHSTSADDRCMAGCQFSGMV